MPIGRDINALRQRRSARPDPAPSKIACWTRTGGRHCKGPLGARSSGPLHARHYSAIGASRAAPKARLFSCLLMSRRIMGAPSRIALRRGSSGRPLARKSPAGGARVTAHSRRLTPPSCAALDRRRSTAISVPADVLQGHRGLVPRNSVLGPLRLALARSGARHGSGTAVLSPGFKRGIVRPSFPAPGS